VIYVDDVNILGESLRTVEKNREALVFASKEIGPKIMLIKLSTWSCLEIRMQDEAII
jgi:hypothetical protein